MEAHIKQHRRGAHHAPRRPRSCKGARRPPSAPRARGAEHLEVEVKNQKRVDTALAAMARIDGPADPPLTEKRPGASAPTSAGASARSVCQGNEDTRNCITWLKLEPVDAEIKALDVEISKASALPRRRRAARGQGRAEGATPSSTRPTSSTPSSGPYQIQQVVLTWMDADRDVDQRAGRSLPDLPHGRRPAALHRRVDPAPVPHPPVPQHAASTRTRWRRSAARRATRARAARPTSSRTPAGTSRRRPRRGALALRRAITTGRTRCSRSAGCTGSSSTTRTTSSRSRLEQGASWSTRGRPLEHRATPRRHDDQGRREPRPRRLPRRGHATRPPSATRSSSTTRATLLRRASRSQGPGPCVDDATTTVKAKWHAVVRKLDNRVQIGARAERTRPRSSPPRRRRSSTSSSPSRSSRRCSASRGVAETTRRASRCSPRVGCRPRRPCAPRAWPTSTRTGATSAARRARACRSPTTCATASSRPCPRSSRAACAATRPTSISGRAPPRRKYIARQARAREGRGVAREGSGRLQEGARRLRPSCPPSRPTPPTRSTRCPTFAEGRQLFRKLNCTGCHILDGYPWDRNSGPALDNMTAKVDARVDPQLDPLPPRLARQDAHAEPLAQAARPCVQAPAARRARPSTRSGRRPMRDETVAIASYLVERSDNPSTPPRRADGDAQPLKAARSQGYADVPGATAEKGKVDLRVVRLPGLPRATSDTGRAPSRGRAASATSRRPSPTWAARRPPTGSPTGSRTRAATGTAPRCRTCASTRVEAASVGKYVASLTASRSLPPRSTRATWPSSPTRRSATSGCPAPTRAGSSSAASSAARSSSATTAASAATPSRASRSRRRSRPSSAASPRRTSRTLDFGYAIPDHHLQTTETFATLKLDSPRIYRRDRIELKMGDFDLSPREIRALRDLPQGPRRAASRAPPTRPPSTPSTRRRSRAGRSSRTTTAAPATSSRSTAPTSTRCAPGPARRRRAGPRPLPQRRGDARAARVALRLPPRPGQERDPPLAPPRVGLRRGQVPDDKLALRMPTFNLNEEQVTAIVRYFASWDGQEYPYEAAKANELSRSRRSSTR